LYHAEHTYGHSPEDLLSVTFAGENPELFFTYYKENLVHLSARPNPAHQALANWESNGPLSAVITQNIDGLHQAAGSRTVHELHGSIWRQYCTRCHERYTLEWTLNPTNCREPNHVVPQCPACGSMVRPDVTLYGEALPEGVMEASAQAIAAADTMIVGGTSLAVYPAAGLVDFFRGSTLILINTSPTPLDHRADIVITQPIGRAMEDIRSLLDE
jgi:NAD-dependent deacetylase